jgi:hypothetical protein
MTRVRSTERVQWHGGALLAGRDLRDWSHHESDLLALHVRAGHGTWGVVEGLAVTIAADRRAVIVTRGSAVTCRGRVIGTRLTTRVEAPASIGAAILVVGPPLREGDECGRTVPGCPDGPVRRSPAVARLQWQPVSAGPAPVHSCHDRTEDVPLGRIARAPDGSILTLDQSTRRVARVRTRARTVAGSVAGEDLLWFASGGALNAFVDTTEAAFETTPAWFVTVSGFAPVTGVLGPFTSIGWHWRSGLMVRLGFAAFAGQTVDAVLGRVRPALETTTIGWLGVESAPTCPRPPVGLRGTGFRFSIAETLAKRLP